MDIDNVTSDGLGRIDGKTQILGFLEYIERGRSVDRFERNCVGRDRVDEFAQKNTVLERLDEILGGQRKIRFEVRIVREKRSQVRGEEGSFRWFDSVKSLHCSNKIS